MNTSKLSLLFLGLVATAAPAAAQQAAQPTQPAPAAQAGAAIAAGTVVRHDKGTDVGTVVRTEGDILIVKTDKYEVPIPRSSVTPHEGVLLFGMTREQLNAAVDQQNAARDAALKPGAAVLGSAGATAGTIEAADAEFVTLKLPSGKAVRLPRTAIALGQSGLVTSLTAAELEAAAGAAATPTAQ